MKETFTIPAPVLFVLNRLESAGYHAYCVGGCVRDHLMGREPGDYDVTTSAKPDEMLKVFHDCRLVETGLQHGTVTIVREGMNIEVTTYRIDGTYDDGRHPDSVTFTDQLSDDLCRRDFTINAMAHSPERGIVDLFGGQEDLARRVIRCVGRAEERFSEDGLRIMRALRFAAVLDFTPDAECSDAVRRLTPLLEKISRERIYVELTKLLGGVGAARILREFPGVIAYVLPGVTDGDVLHAADAIEADERLYVSAGLGRDTAMRYALLFENLADSGARDAICSLKPSRAVKNAVLGYRTALPEAETAAAAKLMSRTDDETPAALARFACVSGKISFGQAEEIRKIADDILGKDLPRRLSMLAVGGSDLAAYGYRGKEIGDKLGEILDCVICGKIGNTKEEIDRYLTE